MYKSLNWNVANSPQSCCKVQPIIVAKIRPKLLQRSAQNCCKVQPKIVSKFNPKLLQGPEDELAGRRAPSSLWPLRNCDPVMATGKKIRNRKKTGEKKKKKDPSATECQWWPQLLLDLASCYFLRHDASWRCLKILDRFWWYIWWYLTMSNKPPMPNIRMFGSGHPVTHIHKILRGFHKWHHKP